MNVYYRREMRHNYLVVELGSSEAAGYEIHMLGQNLIRGLLKFHISCPEGRVCFYYEITSRQPLNRMLESRSLGTLDLRRLILGIAGVLEQLEVFLLPEEQLLLEPEYIYVDPDGRLVFLCLVPGSRQDFPAAVGNLLQYLLGYVDHQDKECVVLAYSLYQESQKENFGINDLLRIVQEDRGGAEPDDDHADIIMEDNYDGIYGNRHSGTGDKLGERNTNADKIVYRKKDVTAKAREAARKRAAHKPGWHKVLGQAAGQLLGKAEPEKVEQEKLPGSRGTKSEREWEAWRDMLEEPEAKPRAQEIEREPVTALLVDLEAKCGNYCLKALQPGLADILVDSFPFIIGKNSSLADYLLEKETVSRLHVKISKDENGFHITDLNSTNGTRVRGRLLENNEEEILCPGDEIYIADWKYRFEQT